MPEAVFSPAAVSRPPSRAGTRRLIAFATILGIAAAALWLGPLRDATRPHAPISITWWAELLACFGTSLFYVDLRLRRARSTLSLTEIPLIMGLFLVDPRVLLGCYAGGLLLGHWLRRGIRPVADYTSLTIHTLYVGVTVLVFLGMQPDQSDPLAPRSLLALAAAMATAGWVIAPVLVNAAHALEQGRLDLSAAMREAAFQVVGSTTNACIGIVGLLLMLDRPWLALALIPPVLLVLAAQLTGSESQRRADRLEFLYHISDVLHSAMRVNDRAGELLTGMSQMFGVTRAELFVLPEERGAVVRFTSVAGEDRAEVSQSELTFAEQEALNTIRAQRIVHVRDHDESSPVAHLLAERGARNGTLVPLRGSDRPQGMLLLAGWPRGKAALTSQEETLLLTVASQITVALEAGQLAGAVRTISAANDELQRRAFYDPLTDIPNRALYIETLTEALQRFETSKRPVACLFVDLDGFKQVNDTYGHAVGDKVLNTMAARLRSQVRKRDMAARIGGDEFGLLLDAMRLRSDAEIVAQRVVRALRQPIAIGDDRLALGGSVGVAVVDDLTSIPAPEELMRRADMAMYLAKRQGKDRYVVFDDTARYPLIAAETPPLRRSAAG